MAPALDAENNLLFLITLVLQSYYRSQIKVGNLQFARIFPGHALNFLSDFGGEAARDKDTEQLAAVCTLFGQFIYSNRVRLLQNSSLMKKGPSNTA